MNGIKRKFEAGYTPQQNSVSECKNRTIVEMARFMLKGARASKGRSSRYSCLPSQYKKNRKSGKVNKRKIK